MTADIGDDGLDSEALALRDAWDGDRAARWVQQSEVLEIQLAPVGNELFLAAHLAPGETVLDVGCGTGPTTRQAAAAVGAAGSVTGLDISGTMLEAAAAVPVAEHAATIEWLQADAVEWSPASAGFDAVVSRFGVMFFSDPARAFANLAWATRPGSRLAIATWARRDESELFAVPFVAAITVLGLDVGAIPDDEGPFSLPDAATIVGVLEPAGWTDVRTVVHHLDLPYGGGLDPAAAALASLDFGPTRVVTADVDDETRRDIVAAIAEALASHVDERGHVVLGGTVLVTTATSRATLR